METTQRTSLDDLIRSNPIAAATLRFVRAERAYHGSQGGARETEAVESAEQELRDLLEH